MVMHFTASQKKAYSALIRLKDAHNAVATGHGAFLQISGRLENGLAYNATAYILNAGGRVTVEKDEKGEARLRIKNADSITILLLSAATNYSNRRDQGWRGASPDSIVDRVLAAANKKNVFPAAGPSSEGLSVLFNRVSLTIGNTSPTFIRPANRSTVIEL